VTAQESIRDTLASSLGDSMKDLLGTIGEETIKQLFEEDALAIQRLKEAISKTRVILTSMQQNQDCFDREDAEHATRMLRVLSHELEWRVRRLSIAIQEYDSKIIKLIQVMQKRKEILT
jgi:hypothetical protein